MSFYETEEHLVATVTDYLLPALHGDEAAVVVATAEHRDAFAAALDAAGVDVEAAARDGRYHVIDAAELLSQFMVDGAPDPARFREVATAVIDAASAGQREVRVYGEMVALLWGDGDVASTIALEDLWHVLVRERGFSLFCGYPIQSFDVRSQPVFEHICGQHSAVVPGAGRR